MSGKAILIAGLPGSGKSTHAKKLLESDPEAVRYVNDYHWKSVDNKPVLDHGRAFADMTNGLRRGETWISSDVEWCRSEQRHAIERDLENEVPDVVVEWHFISCAVDVCCERIQTRGRQGVHDVEKELQILKRLAPEYDIPPGGVVVVTDRTAGGE